MGVKRVAAVTLATLLAVGPVYPATSGAVLKASVTSASGRPLKGVELRLVNLDTGRLTMAGSDASGTLTAELPPGLYSLDTSASGHTLLRGPRVVSLAPGQLLTASLAFAVAAQAPQAGGVTVNHDPIACIIAGQYPQFDASIRPADQLATTRIYFKSPLSDFYYVEMTPGWQGRLPRPTLQASPMTYYIEALGRNGQGARTADFGVRVVSDEKECGGKKVAPIVPTGPSAVFTAAGNIVAAPPGFLAAGGAFAAAGAAGGGGILGLGTTMSLILGGVLLGGVIFTITQVTGEPASPSR